MFSIFHIYIVFVQTAQRDLEKLSCGYQLYNISIQVNDLLSQVYWKNQYNARSTWGPFSLMDLAAHNIR